MYCVPGTTSRDAVSHRLGYIVNSKRITLFSLAIKNLTRKPFRTIALITAVTLATGTLFASTIGIKSVMNSLALGVSRLGADIIVVPRGYEDTVRTVIIAGKPALFYMDKTVVDRVRAVEGVSAASPQYFFKSARYPCCDVLDVLLVAFDPATDFTLRPWLEQHSRRPFTADDVLVGMEIPFMVGDTITFFGKPLNVTGTLESTGMDFIDHTVFLSFEAAYDMARVSTVKAQERLIIDKNRVSTVLVRVAPNTSSRRAAIFIEYEIPGVKAVVADEIIGQVKKQLSLLFKTLLGVSALLWGMTILLIGIVFSMIVNERQRELGILRALGAKRSALFTTLMTEAFLVSCAGGLTGLAASGLFLYRIKEMVKSSLDLPYLWPDARSVMGTAVICLLVAVITGFITALAPVVRSARREPYDAIRQGE